MNPMLFRYGSISALRSEGSAVGAVVVGVVWFCSLVVLGSGVVKDVNGVCCVCTIPGPVAFFCSEILC